MNLNRNSILTEVSVAMAVGVVTSMVYIFSMGYTHGAYNYGDWIFRRGAETPYDAIVSKMRTPFDADWSRLGLLAAGGAVMGGLTLLRYLFPRWPLHPIGFPAAYPCRCGFRRFQFSLRGL